MTVAIMLQGTGSDVGKSVLVAGLCRAFVNRGMTVKPFKPQNMSNNAAVTKTGGEIGRAQALQAIACKTAPTVHMNPVLLKPQSDTGAQIIVQGKVAGTGDSSYYRKNKDELLKKVIESFECLKKDADIIIVEGAGSPAEVNLREHDIANMGFAVATQTPVILIGDIDRGGVIASIVGTHELLSYGDNQLVKGYIINKFRGDMSLFDNALKIITARTGWQNIGILPFVPAVKKLPAEDAVVLDHVKNSDTNNIVIAVPMLSRIANFDDFDPLISEPDIEVRFIPPGDIIPTQADLIIIPGTKATLTDLAFFKLHGWDIDLASHIRRGGKVLGICGGYQMLGKVIADPFGIEGKCVEEIGLGYLDVNTIMKTDKTVTKTNAYSDLYKCEATGYEIHIGNTTGPDTSQPFFSQENIELGCLSKDHKIAGVYLHGLFNDDIFRMKYLSEFRDGTLNKTAFNEQIENALDILAKEMEKHLDLEKIIEIAGEMPLKPTSD